MTRWIFLITFIFKSKTMEFFKSNVKIRYISSQINFLLLISILILFQKVEKIRFLFYFVTKVFFEIVLSFENTSKETKIK